MTSTTALVGLIVALGTALLTCLVVIVAGRVVRAVLDEQRAIRERRVRPQLLVLLAADDDAPPAPLHLHRGDLDVLADLAVPMLRKVRGEARERLADQLHRLGVVGRSRRRLHSVNAVRRARAAAFLGAVGDERAVAALCAALEDRDADVRATAARALGNIRRAEAAPALLNALGAASGAADRVPAGTIVAALLALGPSAAPAALDAAVSSGGSRQSMAVETLGLLGSVPATDVLVGLLAIDPSSPTDVRIRAARALGRIGSPRAMPFLTGVLRADEPWPLRAVAARALGDIGPAAALDELWALLWDPEPTVVVNVARALASTPEGRARLAPLAATVRGSGIVAAAEWAEHQPAVAAAEALAAAGVPVGSGPTDEAEKIDEDEQIDEVAADRADADLTMQSSSSLERQS